MLALAFFASLCCVAYIGHEHAYYSMPCFVDVVDNVDEPYLQEVFDRLNRNVARLRPQELRHARWSGAFNTFCEDLAELFAPGFPNISLNEKKRMSDVEYATNLVLFLHQGPRSLDQEDIDSLYAAWDDEFPPEFDPKVISKEFRGVLNALDSLIADEEAGESLRKSRIRNLADYYSLFGAVALLQRAGVVMDSAVAAKRLAEFADRVEAVRKNANTDHPVVDPTAAPYYDAVRSASNDPGPRSKRIDALIGVMKGEGA